MKKSHFDQLRLLLDKFGLVFGESEPKKNQELYITIGWGVGNRDAFHVFRFSAEGEFLRHGIFLKNYDNECNKETKKEIEALTGDIGNNNQLSKDGILILDPDGKIIDVNPFMFDLLGYSEFFISNVHNI